MAITITVFLIKVSFGLYMALLTLRFLIRLHGGMSGHPIVRQLVRLSSPVTKIFNSVLPTIGNLEIGTLTAIVFFGALTTLLVGTLQDISTPISMLLPWALIGTAYMVCDIYFIAILGQIVISWIAPFTQNPLMYIVNQLAGPLCLPFQRLIPPVAGLDFSPIFVIIGINLMQLMLNSWAYNLQLPVLLVPGI